MTRVYAKDKKREFLQIELLVLTLSMRLTKSLTKLVAVDKTCRRQTLKSTLISLLKSSVLS